MSESQIAEALHAALDEETAGLTVRPDAAHRARRQGRRRKATRGLLATVPAVALAVGGVFVAAHGTGAASPTATHPAVLTAAFVKKQAEAALSSSNADNYIIESTGPDPIWQDSDGEPLTTWIDPVAGRMEQVDRPASGTLTIWANSDLAGGKCYIKQTIVDTAKKTVTTGTGILVTGNQTLTTSTCAEEGFDDIAAHSAFTESGLRQALTTGQATIAGKSVIDGQPVIDLHFNKLTTGSLDSSGPSATETMTDVDLWVNSQNFQPVAMKIGDGSATPYYRWVPRTKALAAQVDTPQIPAGYHRAAS